MKMTNYLLHIYMKIFIHNFKFVCISYSNYYIWITIINLIYICHVFFSICLKYTPTLNILNNVKVPYLSGISPGWWGWRVQTTPGGPRRWWSPLLRLSWWPLRTVGSWRGSGWQVPHLDHRSCLWKKKNHMPHLMTFHQTAFQNLVILYW